jgi:hypothetical protein
LTAGAAAALVLTASLALSAAPPTRESDCQVAMVIDGKLGLHPVLGLKILAGPDALPRFPPGSPAPVGLVCNRDSIVPDSRDYRVAEQWNASLDLATDAQVVDLRALSTGWRLEVLDGPPLTSAQAAAIIKVIGDLNRNHPPSAWLPKPQP